MRIWSGARLWSRHCSRFLAARSTTESEPVALRSKKDKSKRVASDSFEDAHVVTATGGNGGDGCISFLHLWANDKAGPDGGDGGHGGHVVFQASRSVTDLSRVDRHVKADDGEKGYNTDCCGKNARHRFVEVPVGTIVRNRRGVVVGDLANEGSMFVAARGGCGGRGNHFFASDTNQAPQVAEIGARGEKNVYLLELRSMAHFGLIGVPNAGKSTLLRAISRAGPKVADYEFTTLRPYIGVVPYDDYEQIYVADLPGLVEGSHRNEGLGIRFLKHAERCLGLLFVVDVSRENPLSQLEILETELSRFSDELLTRPKAIVANKMDLPEAKVNLEKVRHETDLEVIPISAKTCDNLNGLLRYVRRIYDERLSPTSSPSSSRD